jgi:D-glycero-alpha-D-manno-heptose-7-phosphate kinase
MILTKTPYRISLFGGGSDFPLWYLENGGQVLSFTIDKFCYISARILPPFFSHKHRVVYSQIETVTSVENIRHPAVREIIRHYYTLEHGLEIHYDGDLPARSGVGSSSAFAVGLIHAIKLLSRSGSTDSKILARDAIDLEQNILKENVGSQDQIACSVGGFNAISFEAITGLWATQTLDLSNNNRHEFEDRLVLVYSGLSRKSSDVSQGLIENLQKRNVSMNRVMELAKSAELLLRSNFDLDPLGEMLEESWSIKKSSNPHSITPELEDLRNAALRAGATGIKVLGAGGGGFILCWLSSNSRDKFLANFRFGTVVPFHIYSGGTQVILDEN